MICEHCGKQNPNNSRVCRNCGATMPVLEAGNGFRDILNFKDDTTMVSPPVGSDVDELYKKIRKLKTSLCIMSLVATIAVFASIAFVFKLKSEEPPALTPLPIMTTETPVPTEIPDISPSPSSIPTQTVTAIPQTPTVTPTDDAMLIGNQSEETEKQTIEPADTTIPASGGTPYSSLTDNQPAEESTNSVVGNSSNALPVDDISDDSADAAKYDAQTPEPSWSRDNRSENQLP